jgi:hypothetical protein
LASGVFILAGTQVAATSVMRYDPAIRTFEQNRASGCRMWSIFGSQIGNVGDKLVHGSDRM